MKDIVIFLDKEYDKALQLCKDFDITKENKWTPLIYLNELQVQVGHIYNVLIKKSYTDEPNRSFNNLGDEISDVLLQLINLASSLNINMYDIKEEKNTNICDFNTISILLGQLNEVIMEQCGFRFRKNRDGFNNSFDFVKSRIFRMFIITYNFAKKNNLDIVEEFEKMLDDANNFLNNFDKKKMVEFIDIYDDNKNYLGYSSKENAHKFGYHHNTINVMFVNPKKNLVFFQLKNHNYNNIYDNDFLTITAGGHLQAGESLEDSVREIKEETGQNVPFDQLTLIDKRDVNIKLKDDYIINETQYFYVFKSDVLDDMRFIFDGFEAFGYATMDIDRAIDVLENKGKARATSINQNGFEFLTVDINSFDKGYVDNGLLLDLLRKCKTVMTQKQTIFNKGMYKKLNELYQLDRLMKQRLGDDYYSKSSHSIIETENFFKDEIEYQVSFMNMDDDRNNYFVYLLLFYNNKSISHLLLKQYSDINEARNYFNKLYDFVIGSSNKKIIDKCYNEHFINHNDLTTLVVDYNEEFN